MISNEPSPAQQVSVDPAAPVQQPLAETPLPLDPDNPPWAFPAGIGILKGLLTWFGSVVFLLFVPVVIVVPYFIYLFTRGSAPQADDLMNDKMFLFLSIVGVIPAHVLTFVLAYFVVTGGRRRPFLKTLGLEWPPGWNTWAGYGICTLVALVLLGLGGLITQLYGGEKTQLDMIIESSFAARVATAFLAVATGPFIEEVIYRGIVYPAFARVLGVAWSVVLVSILFAGVHYWQYKNNLAVVGVITLLSVSLTIVRAVTRRLLPSFVIHLVFNGIQSIILLLQPYFAKPEPVTPPPVPAVEIISFALRHLF